MAPHAGVAYGEGVEPVARHPFGRGEDVVEVRLPGHSAFRAGTGGELVGEQGELDFTGQVDFLFQGLVPFFQDAGRFPRLDLRLDQFGDVAGNAHDSLEVPVAAIPREFADLAPGIVPVQPCFMMEPGADGAAGLHDVQFLVPGNVGHGFVKEIGVRPSGQVRRSGDAQLVGRGRVGQNEARFPVLEINAVRNVFNQGMEQVPVLRGAQFRRLAPGDVDPDAYEHDGAALLVPARDAVDPDPAPALELSFSSGFRCAWACGNARLGTGAPPGRKRPGPPHGW